MIKFPYKISPIPFDRQILKYIGRDNLKKRYWYGCLKSKSIGSTINRVFVMDKNKKVFEYRLIFK